MRLGSSGRNDAPETQTLEPGNCSLRSGLRSSFPHSDGARAKRYQEWTRSPSCQRVRAVVARSCHSRTPHQRIRLMNCRDKRSRRPMNVWSRSLARLSPFISRLAPSSHENASATDRQDLTEEEIRLLIQFMSEIGAAMNGAGDATTFIR